MTKIILVCGKAGSGKTTFAHYMQEYINSLGLKAKVLHNAEPVKAIAKESLQWNGVKDKEGRQLLIDLTDMGYSVAPCFWESITDILIKLIKPDVVIIPDWRYQTTHDYFKEHYGDNVTTIKVQSCNVEEGTHSNHSSETAMDKFYLDYLVYNNYDLDYLQATAKDIAKQCL